MLAMSQSRDPGPLADEFGGSALRCGRILERSSSVCHFLSLGAYLSRLQLFQLKRIIFYSPSNLSYTRGCSGFRYTIQ